LTSSFVVVPPSTAIRMSISSGTASNSMRRALRQRSNSFYGRLHREAEFMSHRYSNF
jgi:hypothetical protein